MQPQVGNPSVFMLSLMVFSSPLDSLNCSSNCLINRGILTSNVSPPVWPFPSGPAWPSPYVVATDMFLRYVEELRKHRHMSLNMSMASTYRGNMSMNLKIVDICGYRVDVRDGSCTKHLQQCRVPIDHVATPLFAFQDTQFFQFL